MKVTILILSLVLAGCSGSNSTSDNPPPTDALNFTKQADPVWEGHLVAGDPSVVRVGEQLVMYYTALVTGDTPEDERVLYGAAISADGITWDFAKPVSDESPESVALLNDTEGWDKILETVHVQQIGSEYYMYYTGYPEGVDGTDRLVAEGNIGVARSSDGITFERFLDEPILTNDSPNDKDALFSPTVVESGGTYYMVYTGWCIEDCAGSVEGFGLVGATSADGISWEKESDVVIENSAVPWGINTLEAELVSGPDGLFYLFFTGDVDDKLSAIGVARSENPFGPWEVYPQPILQKTMDWEGRGPIAPAVLIENGKVRVWYMVEINNFSDFYIGYAEADFPLEW